MAALTQPQRTVRSRAGTAHASCCVHFTRWRTCRRRRCRIAAARPALARDVAQHAVGVIGPENPVAVRASEVEGNEQSAVCSPQRFE